MSWSAPAPYMCRPGLPPSVASRRASSACFKPRSSSRACLQQASTGCHDHERRLHAGALPNVLQRRLRPTAFGETPAWPQCKPELAEHGRAAYAQQTHAVAAWGMLAGYLHFTWGAPAESDCGPCPVHQHHQDLPRGTSRIRGKHTRRWLQAVS